MTGFFGSLDDAEMAAFAASLDAAEAEGERLGFATIEEVMRETDLVVVTIARRIGQRPLLGRIEPRLAQPRFRVWSLPSFSLLVVYNATTDPVRIVRIVHTAQDLPKVLKDLRS